MNRHTLSNNRIGSQKEDNIENDNFTFQCLAVNISPELGERVCMSGERALIEEIFPEISQTIMDSSKAAAWNQDAKHVIRFPLNGFCKLNSLQTISRLLNHGFRVMASNGGGVEGQQFSEYLMVRKSALWLYFQLWLSNHRHRLTCPNRLVCCSSLLLNSCNTLLGILPSKPFSPPIVSCQDVFLMYTVFPSFYLLIQIDQL